jgi:hypothetical protein
MAITLTQHIDLPPMYVCPTCLKPTPFFGLGDIGRSVRSTVSLEVRGLTFANGEARQVSVSVEGPAIEWPEPETPFGIVPE